MALKLVRDGFELFRARIFSVSFTDTTEYLNNLQMSLFGSRDCEGNFYPRSKQTFIGIPRLPR